MCGKPNGRKKLEAVGSWSGELQSVEDASAKLNQNPVWNSFGGRNLGQFSCEFLGFHSKEKKT